MTVVKMELGEPDASGRRRPVEIEGSEYDIEVDTVIMSLGTSPNPLISSTTVSYTHLCHHGTDQGKYAVKNCIFSFIGSGFAYDH